MDSALGSDLAPVLGDLSQSEKLSEINPPLLYDTFSIVEAKVVAMSHDSKS